MEGVLDTLMGILTPAAAAEDDTVPTENHSTSTPATVMAEQPASAHTVTAVQDSEIMQTSDLSNDIGNSQKILENSSSHETSVELHSDDAKNASSMDMNSASIESLDSHTSPPEPQSNVPLSSSNIVSQSLVNNDAVTEKEDVDAGVTVQDSLTHSLPPLSAVPLTIPLCPPRYLKLSFLPDEKLVSRFLHLHCKLSLIHI